MVGRASREGKGWEGKEFSDYQFSVFGINSARNAILFMGKILKTAN